MSSEQRVRSARPARQARPTDSAAAFDSKDAKRARREAALAQRERLEAAERQRRRLMWAGLVLAAPIALGALGWWLFGPTN